MSNALVELGRLDQPGSARQLMLTDANGRFVFYNLPRYEGYYLIATATGYARSRYAGLRSVLDQGRPTLAETINLSAGEWIDGLKFGLSRLGSISGTVTDERGEPLVGVVVRAAVRTMIAGHAQLIGGPVAVTDDKGEYRLAELADGDYLLSVPTVQSAVSFGIPETASRRPVGQLETGFAPGNGASLSWPALLVGDAQRLALSTFPVSPSPAGNFSYQTQWYSAVSGVDDAEVLRMRGGESKSGIDFRMRPVIAGKLAGRVTPASKYPLLLRLLPTALSSLGFGFEAATTTVESDGQFTFLRVPAGEYTLIAQTQVSELGIGMSGARIPDAPGYPAGGVGVGLLPGSQIQYVNRQGQPANLAGRQTVSTNGQDRTDLLVDLQPTLSLHGRIVLEPGIPESRSNTFFLVRAEPANGDPSLGIFTTFADRGTLAFTLDGLLPVKYVVSVDSSLSVASVSLRGVVQSQLVVDAGKTSDLSEVVITLSSKTSEVSGTVTGVPDAIGAAVVVFPADRQGWSDYGFVPTRIKSTAADAKGAYQIRGLPAGEYLIAVIPLANIDGWRDPKYLASIVTTATPLKLAAGASVAANLSWRSR